MYKGLKQLRKAAGYMRAVYFLLDKHHVAPPALNTFFKSLGHFLDAFWMPDKAHPDLASVRKSAAELHQGVLSSGIRADSLENISRHAHDRLQALYALARTNPLSAHDFHLLRKRLRSFTNIFTLVVKQNPGHASAGLREVLFEINDELGDINDDLVQKTLHGIHVYTEQHVTLRPELRQQLLDLLSHSSAPTPAAQPVAPPQSPANPIW